MLLKIYVAHNTLDKLAYPQCGRHDQNIKKNEIIHKVVKSSHYTILYKYVIIIIYWYYYIIILMHNTFYNYEGKSR